MSNPFISIEVTHGIPEAGIPARDNLKARLRSDRLAVRVYARHGDMCACCPGHCASRHNPDDFVLVARFAYLQEGIDYATRGAASGVSTRLVSRIVPSQPFVRDYPARAAQPAA